MAAAPVTRSVDPNLPPGAAQWLKDVKALAHEINISLIALQDLIAKFEPWTIVLNRFANLNSQFTALHELLYGRLDEPRHVARVRDQCRKLLLKPQLGAEGLLPPDIFRSGLDFFEVSEKLKKSFSEFNTIASGLGLGGGNGDPSSSEKASPGASATATEEGGGAGQDAMQTDDPDDVVMTSFDDFTSEDHDAQVPPDHINMFNREVLSLKQFAARTGPQADRIHEAGLDEKESTTVRGRLSEQVLQERLLLQLNSINFGHRLR